METNETPRFEFRLFGNALCQTLEQALQTETVEHTAKQIDIYLLAATDTDVNLKLRANKLNTKVLMRRQQGLECWHPHLDMAFPLSSGFLREIFFPLLRVQAPVLAHQSYAVEPFMELLGAMANVQMVRVHKQRRHYCIDGCQVELSTLYVANCFYTRTAALEAVDPMTVHAVRARLGLLNTENVNYMLGLKRLLQANPALAEMPTNYAPIPVQFAATDFAFL